MKLKAVATHGLMVAGLVALVVGQASPAAALSFFYSQSTGFEMGSQVLEVGFPVTPEAANSGVQFYQESVNPNTALNATVGPFPGDIAPPPNTFTTIAWGCNLAGTSCAPPGQTVVPITDPDPRLTNPARSGLLALGRAGEVIVDGLFVPITHLEHTNRAITGKTLFTVDIESILRIGTTPPTRDPALGSQTINVAFKETVNSPPCAPPNPLLSTCDDFFTFNFGSFAPLVITHDGQQYDVVFDLANRVNADFRTDPTGTTGTIFTAESTTGQIDVVMAIRSRSVPEPATLMLLGAGLIGVGFAAAKRRRNKI